LLVLENLESFKRGAEIPASVLLFFTIDVVLGIAIIEFSVVNSRRREIFSRQPARPLKRDREQ
jgi:hypothetical protein